MTGLALCCNKVAMLALETLAWTDSMLGNRNALCWKAQAYQSLPCTSISGMVCAAWRCQADKHVAYNGTNKATMNRLLALSPHEQLHATCGTEALTGHSGSKLLKGSTSKAVKGRLSTRAAVCCVTCPCTCIASTAQPCSF